MAPQQYHDNPNVHVHEFEDEESGYSYEEPLHDEPPRGSFRNSSGGIDHGVSLSRIHPLPSGAGDSHQAPLVDFDAFASDAEKLSAILKCADAEGHKHALAVDYYRFRRYLLLVPIVLMSLFVAIAGFIAASDVMSEAMQVGDSTMQEFLTILVATFGFLVLLLTLLLNGLDYNSAVRFHRAASEDLHGLCDKVRLYRMERAVDERAREEDEDLFPDDDASTSDESSDEEEVADENAIIPHQGNALQVKRQLKKTKKMHKRQEKLTKKLVKQKVRQAREEQELSKDVITFYGYHAQLHQITIGCRSDVPPQISKFFQVMESRVELMSLSRLGVEEESRMRKNQIVRLCAHEIYNEVSNFALWPLLTPNVDRTVEGALKTVGQMLNMNYRAQKRCKLIPCCPIPLCCKKKTTDNVFAIINEGIDQRELDMMQAERTELVRREEERRAQRIADPEEVLEVKDPLYSDSKNDPGGRRASKEYSGMYASGLANHFASGKSQRSKASRRSRRSRRSQASQDPEGQSINGVVTEASYSFAGNGPPTEPALDLITEGDLVTEDDGTFGTDYASYDEEAGLKEKKKRSKKSKKKKKKQHKKKKEKAKRKEERPVESDEYSEAGEEYTEYSEEE
ncbi:hypothetical protein ACHAXT_005241 [Thalassiosira profunda]